MSKYGMSKAALYEYVKNVVLAPTATPQKIRLEVERIQKGDSKLLPGWHESKKGRRFKITRRGKIK